MRLGITKFNSKAAGRVDIATATLMARMSRISYLPESEIEPELIRRVDQPERLAFFGNDSIDTFGYVADYKDFTVVVFRGSDSIKDWLGNIQVVKKQFNFAPGKIHGGFGTAVDMTWLGLMHALQPSINESVLGKRDIWLTGHSLGGAMALLAAAHLKTDGVTVKGVCTFGQPMVGNAAFAGLFRRIEHWRIVNKRDVVPLMPNQFSAGQYTHAGRFYWLRGDGNIRVNEAAESIYKSQSRVGNAPRNWDGKSDAIEDHRIENYCDELELLNDNAS